MTRTDTVAWEPDASTRARARISSFMEELGIESFEELHRRSVEDVAWFTEEVLRFLGIRFDPHYEQVLDLSAGVPWARWCVGGGLNAAKACLEGAPAPDATAVVWEGEEGNVRSLSYAELADQVRSYAAGLRSLGVGRGDAVGIHLSMGAEAAITLLAVGWNG